MATATPTKKADTKKDAKAAAAPANEAKAPRLKKDGTPWADLKDRRSNEEILADYVKRREEFIERSRKVVKNFDKKIAYFTKLTTSGEDVVKEVLAEFSDLDEIAEMEAKLRKAKAALKGKSPEEIAALKAEVQASRVPVSGIEDDEPGDEE